MRYYILAKWNTGSCMVGQDNQQVDSLENAMIFTTEKEAEKWISSAQLSEWDSSVSFTVCQEEDLSEMSYTFNGEKVVIVSMSGNNPESSKLDGVEVLDTYFDKGLIRLSDAMKRGLDVDEVELAYEDSYDGFCSGDEIVHGEVENFENDQKLSYDYVAKVFAEEDYYQRMFKTMTDKYYSWTSYLKSFCDMCIEQQLSPEEARVIWEEEESKYPTTDDRQSFSYVWTRFVEPYCL